MAEQSMERTGAVLEVDPFAKELGRLFRENGHELYLVGGGVRDVVLGRPTADLDFATDAHPPDTTKVLRGWADRVFLLGVRFGTVGGVHDDRRVEVTTFREEVYAEDDRKPRVSFAKDIDTDLSRRDFTINAMAVRLPEGEFVDPLGGLRHLASKVLETPLEPELAFSDDPLRMLRAARFVAQLDLRPTARVLSAIESMRDRLDIVSRERIEEEFSRLVCSQHAGKGLRLLVETRLAEVFVPEIAALHLEQDPVHQHKDVFAHTLAVVEQCDPDDLVVRLAGLFHDVGKPQTRQVTPEGVSFHHHEIVGARLTEARLRELRYPAKTIDEVRRLVELHLRFHGYGEGWTDSAVRRYVRDAGPLLDRLNQLTRADVTTRNEGKARRFRELQDELEERIARLAEEENLKAMRPPLDGRQVMAHLGLKPGPLVGEALEHLMELRMDRGPIPDDEAYKLLDQWAAERGIGGPH